MARPQGHNPRQAGQDRPARVALHRGLPRVPGPRHGSRRGERHAAAAPRPASAAARSSMTGAKAWRQKGTGRARVGALSVPHRRGGGAAFGPKPRGYTVEGQPQGSAQGASRRALGPRRPRLGRGARRRRLLRALDQDGRRGPRQVGRPHADAVSSSAPKRLRSRRAFATSRASRSCRPQRSASPTSSATARSSSPRPPSTPSRHAAAT